MKMTCWDSNWSWMDFGQVTCLAFFHVGTSMLFLVWRVRLSLANALAVIGNWLLGWPFQVRHAIPAVDFQNVVSSNRYHLLLRRGSLGQCYWDLTDPTSSGSTYYATKSKLFFICRLSLLGQKSFGSCGEKVGTCKRAITLWNIMETYGGNNTRQKLFLY